MSQRDYEFCPYCATRLETRTVFQQLRRICPACGFVQFRDPKVAVIGLVTCAGKVLLIRRGVDPMRGKWALPGGYMDAGEMPQAALARELQEEVGLAVEVQQLVAIFPMAGQGVVNLGIVLAFAGEAGGVVGDQLPALVCDDDVVEAGWFGAAELPTDLAFDSTLALLDAWRAQQPPRNQPQ